MQNHEFDTRPKNKPGLSKQVVERRRDEHEAQAFLPQRDPFAPVIRGIGDASSAGLHASMLNRATNGRPYRAGQSLLQLQRQFGNRYVQRVLALARKGTEEAEAAPEVEQSIQQARGGGQALDSKVRSQMEPAFGADFSGVRVHTGAQSDTLNRALNARAFTTGQDIFFRQEAYNPGSSSGRELIAHELTHVLQQTGGVQFRLTVSQVGDKYEQEADSVAQVVMQRDRQVAQTQTKRGIVHRQEEEQEKLVQTELERSQVQSQKEEEEETFLQTKGLISRKNSLHEQITNFNIVAIQRTSTTSGGITWYSTKAEAEAAVPTHVSPKSCFVWHGGGPSGHPWRVIPGTGCAHWVAHQKGTMGSPGCYVGNAIRVSQVISGLTSHTLQNASVGDIWTNTGGSHCGIVRMVNSDKSGTVTSVSVEHCSSGSGGVVTSSFTSGLFYR